MTACRVVDCGYCNAKGTAVTARNKELAWRVLPWHVSPRRVRRYDSMTFANGMITAGERSQILRQAIAERDFYTLWTGKLPVPKHPGIQAPHLWTL